MAGLGPTEILIILGIVVIIFGAGKLPEIGGALGKGIREFKAQTSDDAELLPQPVPVAVAADADVAAASRQARADDI